MILRNLSSNLIVTKDLKEAKSFIDQLLGLLKKSNPRSLLFKSRFGIYTFFLTELIDVVILDRDFKVVKLKEGLKPNRVFFWKPVFFYCLELPAGVIKRSVISLGDKLIVNE